VSSTGGGRAARREALLALAGGRDAGAVVLSSFGDVAWYTGGFDVRIDRSGTTGSTVVLVSAAGEWVITNAIEAPRLRAEEPALSGFEIVDHPWTGDDDGVIRLLAGDLPVVRDLDVAPLRRVLDGEAIERYRVLGADLRAVFDAVEGELRPATTELEAAAMVAAAAWRVGGHTPVLLVAGADRIPRYRHPLPTAAPLGGRAMLVACLERGGLYASLTRFVDLGGGPPPGLAVTDELLRRMREEATVAGATLGDAYEACARFYAEAGVADEVTRHHQGGIAGYASREVIARPGDQTVIEPGMAFAWNPSVTGAKSEETFVLGVGGSTEVLT
jgi:hypothetical protein